MMGDVLRDLRFALRSLRRRPGFFGVVVVTLALGIGATTAVFSVVEGVLLRPLPYDAPDRLVQIGTLYEGLERIASSSPPDFFDWQDRSRSVQVMAASRLERMTLLGEGEPRQVDGAGVSAAYFDVLAVEPSLGRAFTDLEDRTGASPVAVLSRAFWSELGGDRSILGRTLTLDGRPFTVVGVMGPDFHPPEAIYHGEVDVWYPLAHIGDPLDMRDAGFLQVIGRLAPGVTPNAAADELSAIERSLSATYGRTGIAGVGVEPLQSATLGDVGDRIWIVMGAVALLLLIACANVANLFLVRATERDHEMVVRSSLGASWTRLVRQLLTESVVLATVSALMATLLAHGLVRAFVAWSPTALPRISEVAVNPRVLGFTLLLTLVTGLLFGMVPVLGGRGVGWHGPLRAGNHSGSARATTRLRDLLVIGETAVAMILFVGAGLLLNSFVRLAQVDPGFRTENVTWMEVRVPGEDLPTPDERIAFFREVEAGIGALPGVRTAGATNNLPLSGNNTTSGLSLEDQPADLPLVSVSWSLATERYFAALDIPLGRGRVFTEADDADATRVALVSESLARRLWPGEDPLGRRVKSGPPDSDQPWITVVGVVGDVHHSGLGQSADEQMYLPFAQAPRTGMYIVVHTDPRAQNLLPSMRQAVWELDPTLPLERGGSLEAHVAESVVEPWFYTLLLASFAAFALLLATVGIYGTMTYVVRQRTRELGVRVALGAARRDVIKLVLGRGMALTAAGLALGLAGSLMVARVLEGMMYGITPTDPATLVAVLAIMASVAFVACWLPARRATRLDPVRSLKAE